MTTASTRAPRPADDPGSGRLHSLDALRGFDMFWIMGGDTLATALLDRIPSPAATTLKAQLEHVEWEGFRFYDLIFPLFLFLVGCVIPFSLHKYSGQPTAAAGRILRRTTSLILLGLICNGLLNFNVAELRWCGVLQRIGICYGAAALLCLCLTPRKLSATIVAILLGYWALLALVPAPGTLPGDYSKAGNLAGWVDRTLLPGKILSQYYGDGDNEGLLSTIPAIATPLIGCLAGIWLRSQRTGLKKSCGLFAAGAVLLLLGTAWGHLFPIIKNLWTSSFVLVAAGWSLLLTAVFHLIIDVIGFRRWAFPLTVIGVNAITIYVAPRFIDFDHLTAFFLSGTARLCGNWNHVVLAAGVLLTEWLFLLWLYRSRTFLRL
ncbi:MAG: acyltransferase family protein [Planctomycetaceae bacterium]